MAQRTARLYSSTDPIDLLSELSERLHAIGVNLQHPTSGKAFRISDEGDQLSTTEGELREFLSDLGDASFSWWISADHDLYCRIRKCDETAVAELGLEGCTAEELKTLQELLRSWAASQAASGRLVGFVYDRDGISVDCDWDQVFLEGVPLELACRSTEFTGLLAEAPSRPSHLRSPDGDIPITELHGFILAVR